MVKRENRVNISYGRMKTIRVMRKGTDQKERMETMSDREEAAKGRAEKNANNNNKS